MSAFLPESSDPDCKGIAHAYYVYKRDRGLLPVPDLTLDGAESVGVELRAPQEREQPCPICHTFRCIRCDDELNRELVDAGITWPWREA